MFDIFSELRYSKMPEFLVPDIKRHQLEDIILNIKSLDIKQDRVENFMKLLIEPPEPVRVASALKVLEGVGALDPEQKVCNKQIELIKFIYSEKDTKFCGIFTLLLSYVVPVKSKVKISQIYVAFSQYMNFNS